MHALIIEDDYLISQSIQDMLADLGFNSFSFARSEDAAIAGATGEKFDLITADARLLPGDGVRAVQTICANRKVPVVFITGYKEEVHGRLEGGLRTATVLQKPVKGPEFSAAVQEALGRS